MTDREILENPTSWPHYPILPLKRINYDETIERGLLVVDDDPIGLSGQTREYRLFRGCTLYYGPQGEGFVLTLDRLQARGWEVALMTAEQIAKDLSYDIFVNGESMDLGQFLTRIAEYGDARVREATKREEIA